MSENRFDPDALARDLMPERVSLTGLFPEVSVARGGIRYKQPTPAESRAREAMQAHVERIINAQVAARDALLQTAVREAAAHGWDVTVHWRPPHLQMRTVLDVKRNAYSVPPEYIGIGYSPQEVPGAVQMRVLTHDETDLWDDE